MIGVMSKMAEGYEYPLIDGLNVDEIIDVVNFFETIEQAYEETAGIKRADFIKTYRKFQEVVPAKMEQKQLETEFAHRSGYDSYEVIKLSKDEQLANLTVREA
ncbi:UPF0223 family protein [Lentilactobacillus parakefiri]|uniref:Uncharacterized protein n=2 Tax=Lentilactobacillus parakefiri TaxID=152332 RepID=A0A224VK74_9LACO|nr:UPF0223 family protein [Lentilactobacillus parakefiri]KRL66026.1 hypothetical protein FD08_GL002043 [Lentilactobacillus parakefiri DSM 10551]TDG91093.1 hypothetical protein C5L28_001628 [Lentilactobacillus parakefiri]GAW72734.1 hypothetical protein LPKJCM_01864 [Lentilactobacillus parakefiri]